MWPILIVSGSLYNKSFFVKNRYLKYQSRLYISSLVKEGIINIEKVEGVIDFVKWMIKAGQTKSINRIDDILTLTSIGYKLLTQINTKEKRDKLCWS